MTVISFGYEVPTLGELISLLQEKIEQLPELAGKPLWAEGQHGDVHRPVDLVEVAGYGVMLRGVRC